MKSISIIIVMFAVIFANLPARAFGTHAAVAGLRGDSLLPVRANYDQNEEVRADLLDVEDGYRTTGDNRRAFSRLLKILRRRSGFRDTHTNARLFNDLAGVYARLKLYPLAMKCYCRAIQWSRKTRYSFLRENTDAGVTLADSSGCILGALVPDGTGDPDLSMDRVSWPAGNVVNSEPTSGEDLWGSFADGKIASCYAFLVEVKQPVAGKRRAFTGINNVGHMFITLIKFNKDNSFVSRSFGFYPRKSGIFSATPVHPGAASVFKDDAMHDWDELAGKFISFRTFQKVITMMKSYEQMSYHLNRNNCTDFGLAMARIGGINITDATGSWPLGRGNNPGNAGQSMLEGKINNIDAGYREPLFVSTNINSGVR